MHNSHWSIAIMKSIQTRIMSSLDSIAGLKEHKKVFIYGPILLSAMWFPDPVFPIALGSIL